jgi:DNA-binding NarL/FixJ family response regulator
MPRHQQLVCQQLENIDPPSARRIPVSRLRPLHEAPNMTQPTPQLTARSIAILEMVAAGHSYEQILAAHPELTYRDIFRAAEEALASIAGQPRQGKITLAERRKHHPRAYEPWSPEEEKDLQQFIEAGLTVPEIAGRLQRRRSAIRSRILKLDLTDKLPPGERDRLNRIRERFENQ